MVKYVDPRYTSQKCNKCGNIDKNNRNGAKYICKCGYKNHSDINAAMNIRDNYVQSLSKKKLEQVAIDQPIVSKDLYSLGTIIPY